MLISSSKTRITPEGKFFPCYLLGHAIRTENALGVSDELWANAIVLKVSNQTLIWVTVELAGLNKEVSQQLRQTLSDQYQVPLSHINIAFTHTHSGPEYDVVSPFLGKEKAAVPGYMEFVSEQILQAVRQCFDQDFKECKAWMKKTTIDGFYSNRNGLDKIADKEIITLEFDHEGITIAGILHFTCHPTVLGPQNRFVSGDLAGYLAREMQNRWGVYACVMQGAAGDMSNRLYRQGNDYQELKRIGDGIMAQIDANTEKIALNVEECQVETYRYTRTYTLDTEKKKAQIAAIEEKLANAKTFDETKVYTSALAGAKARMNKTEGAIDLQCSLIKMQDLFIATMPAELFSCFGLMIKQAAKVKCPILWGYSNYSVGYLVNRAEYGDSFESAASEIPIGTTEEIVEEIIAKMSTMHD